LNPGSKKETRQLKQGYQYLFLFIAD